jgi:enoyl-CoA hydratase/carnithine racemase
MCRVSKPVICAVNGLANGGGLHFIADSDIVIASQKAAFMDTHVSVGQVSGLESIGIARRAGLGAALLLGLAGKAYRMPAERAYQLGMVDLLEEDAAATRARRNWQKPSPPTPPKPWPSPNVPSGPPPKCLIPLPPISAGNSSNPTGPTPTSPKAPKPSPTNAHPTGTRTLMRGVSKARGEAPDLPYDATKRSSQWMV